MVDEKINLGYDDNIMLNKKSSFIMVQEKIQKSKEQIMSALQQLLVQNQAKEGKIETKEQIAEKEKNQELLTKVADYTVDNIVNRMATVQLDFSNLTKEIGDRLETESEVLTELKKAIKVEQEKLVELRQVRLVADALYILRQEHEEKIRLLENQTEEAENQIQKQQEKNRKIWAKEEAEFETLITESAELLQRQREQEKSDYDYHLEVDRKHEMDEYEETKRVQERELRLANQEKNKAWQERDEVLANQEAEFNTNQEKIAGFEEKIKTEVNKARGEAIKEANKEAEVKANLIEKEWDATKQGLGFQIESLEAKIQQQNEEIEAIMAQLQNATDQSQNLALRAFQPTNN